MATIQIVDQFVILFNRNRSGCWSAISGRRYSVQVRCGLIHQCHQRGGAISCPIPAHRHRCYCIHHLILRMLWCHTREQLYAHHCKYYTLQSVLSHCHFSVLLPCMFQYAVILLTIFILQVALGVFAFLQFKDEKQDIKEAVSKQLKSALEQYNTDKRAQESFNSLQYGVCSLCTFFKLCYGTEHVCCSCVVVALTAPKTTAASGVTAVYRAPAVTTCLTSVMSRRHTIRAVLQPCGSFFRRA